jgi:hypothetical protein
MKENVKLKHCGLFLKFITKNQDIFMIYTTGVKLFLEVCSDEQQNILILNYQSIKHFYFYVLIIYF